MKEEWRNEIEEAFRFGVSAAVMLLTIFGILGLVAFVVTRALQ